MQDLWYWKEAVGFLEFLQHVSSGHPAVLGDSGVFHKSRLFLKRPASFNLHNRSVGFGILLSEKRRKVSLLAGIVSHATIRPTEGSFGEARGAFQT
jgi:hypothetical protein